MRDTDERLRRRQFIGTAAVTAIGAIAGCSNNSSSDGSTTDGGSSDGSSSDGGSSDGSSSDGGSSDGSDSPYSAENQEIVESLSIDELQPDELLVEGPRGLEPEPPEVVSLSDSQLSEVESQDLVASIVFGDIGTSWARLQRKGLEARYEELGITLQSVQGSSNFNAQEQADIVRSLSSSESLDGIASRPVSSDATTDAYQSAAEAGIDLVFMDDIPSDLKHPDHFSSMISTDQRANGLISGEIMARFVGEGDVLMVEFAGAIKSITEREKGFRQAIDRHDGVSIADTVEFSNPNNVQNLSQNMMTANPNAKGIWTPWNDPPGMQTVAAARENGKDPNEFHITTVDLGTRSAINMAKGSYIKGIGAQRVFEQGVTEANALALSMIGESTPAYIGVPALPVTRENLREAYEIVYNEAPPADVTDHF